MKIYLIGMPGSGKTTLGKQLAALVNLPFIDLDSEIEKKEGKSVSMIFSEYGEPYFRQAEAETLRQTTAQTHSFIMATGGGTPCFYEGMEFMNQSGLTVFLDVPVNQLADRLQKEGIAARPLLSGQGNLVAELTHLRLLRLRFYEKANVRMEEPDANALARLINIRK